ncbi:YtxH domain-containing protein [Streptococcus infantis]|uniref:YtxH domain-containing protein n=1 Tax=Streptococcus infantis TaxID=68892 RepID=UPI0039C282A0
MGKLSSILLGTVSGVAVALFLTSEKGKRVTSQAQDFLEDLKEDPEYAKEQVCEKLADVKDQTKEFVLKTKEQIESGEITIDTVLDKAKYHAQQATEASKETLNNLKEQLEEKVVVEEQEDGQEIIIEIEED